jgi:hydroxymethylpyrimidine/phosphomethylpyrimidine kinase
MQLSRGGRAHDDTPMTPIAVTIAASDSSGGAGIQADLKSFSALAVYGATIITALTAQNTREILAIEDVPADFIVAQMNAVFSDLKVDAVKIGMVRDRAGIEAIASGLARWSQTSVVLDPVMAASSGMQFLSTDAIEVLKNVLIPRALLVTPNLAEAAMLLHASIACSQDEMRKQGERLLELGAKAVLVKGGHSTGAQSIDLLVERDGVTLFPADRVQTHNTHGTGCTLSAAIAAFLAKRLALAEAVRLAKRYVTDALMAADRIKVGHGAGPLHHFHGSW